MTAAARQHETSGSDTEVDDIGAEALELTNGYIARLRTLGDDLGTFVGCRDGAWILAAYVQYSRDVALVSDEAPVGLAKWVRALEART